jgi:hypothetical protein
MIPKALRAKGTLAMPILYTWAYLVAHRSYLGSRYLIESLYVVFISSKISFMIQGFRIPLFLYWNLAPPK